MQKNLFQSMKNHLKPNGFFGFQFSDAKYEIDVVEKLDSKY